MHHSHSSNRFSSGTMRQASWCGDNSKCGGYTRLPWPRWPWPVLRLQYVNQHTCDHDLKSQFAARSTRRLGSMIGSNLRLLYGSAYPSTPTEGLTCFYDNGWIL